MFKDKVYNFIKYPNLILKNLNNADINRILFYNNKIINIWKNKKFNFKLLQFTINNLDILEINKTVKYWILYNIINANCLILSDKIIESKNNDLKWILNFNNFINNKKFTKNIPLRNSKYISCNYLFNKYINSIKKSSTDLLLFIKNNFENFLKLEDNYFFLLNLLRNLNNNFIKNYLLNLNFNGHNIVHKICISINKSSNQSIRNLSKIIIFFYKNNKSIFSELNKNGKSPLFYIFLENKKTFIPIFRNLKKYNIHYFKDENGNTLLHFVKKPYQYRYFKELININKKNKNNKNCLELIMRNKSINFIDKYSLVCELLKDGIEIDKSKYFSKNLKKKLLEDKII